MIGTYLKYFVEWKHRVYVLQNGHVFHVEYADHIGPFARPLLIFQHKLLEVFTVAEKYPQKVSRSETFRCLETIIVGFNIVDKKRVYFC
jgi:hypothetical protein